MNRFTKYMSDYFAKEIIGRKKHTPINTLVLTKRSKYGG